MKFIKKLKSLFMLAMAACIAFSATLPVFAADEGVSYASESSSEALEPIPLLVIKISFDADGDGKDCYYDEDIDWGSNKDKDHPCYGEQWCYSDDEWWYEQLFSDDKFSLKSYYSFISNGRFYFYPAEESYSPDTYKNAPNNGAYDGINDGVVHVVINCKHPEVSGNDLADGDERILAIKAADEYVDFSKYDKNGDGYISYTELAIAFVYGGTEVSRTNKTTIQYAYKTHAHVTSSNLNISVDGVRVLNSGYSSYLRVGESTVPNYLTYGTFAHELGHVLGAADLYTTNNIFIGSPGSLSLMGSGSGGQANGVGRSGSSPSILDPYYSVRWGFADATLADKGENEYTLYSHESGQYNVLRVNTSNPNEYYLVENRSHSNDSYDYNGLNNDIQGILIWHVDENTMRSTMAVNNGGRGHDAGLTVLTPNGNIQATGASTTFTSSTAQFVCTNYKFTYSGTWYTVMSDEEASGCYITIDVLSEAGDEMVVRVNSTTEIPPEYSVSTSETYDSVSIGVNITDPHDSTINGCKIYLSTDSDMPEGSTTVKAADVDENGNYAVKFDGLNALTRYYYVIELDTSKGTFTRNGSAMTPGTPVAATSYTVYFYKGLQENEKPTSKKVNFGEKLTYSFPMTKSGYAFVGWYLDSEFTQKYDMDYTQDGEGDITLYAKWVPESEACTLKFVGATVNNKVFSALVGETFITPEISEKDGYEFGGWYTDDKFTVPFDFSSPVSATGTVTLYAKWISLNGDEDTTVPPITTPANTETPNTDPVDLGDKSSSSTTLVGCIIVVVVVVLAIVVVAVVLVKKKKK